ncbi:hypothetical protein [Brevibacillus parabrevis]|uniref:helix-turn-helix transcriptional regulator n=1 Tax=Brevibacillus parabrevis TaxID=54914 RepID=UPI0028D3E845|nr:hypothetical protein [Brevibacillus parabrevis]
MKGVNYMLERMPSHVHLYLTGRNAPSRSLSRIRMGNGLNRLDASDLRFAPDETTEFFANCGGMELSIEDVAAVQKKTEGWSVYQLWKADVRVEPVGGGRAVF